jgi:CheY-like chemotaxis protein
MTNCRNQSDVQRRVLLVDDQDPVRDSVYTLLESDGYEVLAAKNGPDGLAIFHRSLRSIDLLVTDCNMPGMTGMDLARACARRNPLVVVLYLSGSRPDEELQAELETCGRAFLAKPFRGDDLLRKARELLATDAGRVAVPGAPALRMGIQRTQ